MISHALKFCILSNNWTHPKNTIIILWVFVHYITVMLDMIATSLATRFAQVQEFWYHDRHHSHPLCWWWGKFLSHKCMCVQFSVLYNIAGVVLSPGWCLRWLASGFTHSGSNFKITIDYSSWLCKHKIIRSDFGSVRTSSCWAIGEPWLWKPCTLYLHL